jgi:hypothetical protein
VPEEKRPSGKAAPTLPLMALVLVAAVNVAGLALVDDPIDVFGCLNPFGEPRQCVGMVRTQDQISAPDLSAEAVSTVAGSRTAPYGQLRELAPDAIYLLAVPAPHIWGVSPLLLATVGQAGDVRVLPVAVGTEATGVFDPSPQALPAGDQRFDIAVGQARFRARLGVTPVATVLVFQSGTEIVFLDVRLLPEPLATRVGELR